MKKIKNLLLLGVLLIFGYPQITNADTGPLDYSYQKLAKLDGETSYVFSSTLDEYEYFVSYDTRYLDFTEGNVLYRQLCEGKRITIVDDNKGKITIRRDIDVSFECNAPVELRFKTLKEGSTKLGITSGKNTWFSYAGGPQEFDDIITEIVNLNKECPTCKECPVCKDCVECEKCEEGPSTTKLYVIIGISVFVAIVVATLLIVPRKK